MTEEALILIEATSDRLLKNISEEVGNLKNVERSAVISGPYDIVAWIKASNSEEVSRLINDIRKVSGVKKTVTNVVIG